MTRYLWDTSVWNRTHHPAVALRLTGLVGLPVVCLPVALEMGVSVRNQREHERLSLRLRVGAEWVSITGQMEARAVQVQGLLTAGGLHRAAGVSDLLVAVVAEAVSATVLHYDSDFDLIAGVTGQPVEWVVPQGSVP